MPQFDYTSVPRLKRNAASITGPDLIYPGQSGVYKVTNYDDFHDWSVGTDKGAVSQTDDLITLTMPAGESAGTANLTVTRNGISDTLQIAVGTAVIAKPVIQSPANGATGISKNPVFYGSTFSILPGGYESLVSVELRIATDAAMINVIHTETTNNTAVALPDTVLSAGQTTYYADLQYKTATLTSERSDVISFTTEQTFMGVGTVIDGDIVAGQINGYWVLVAPANKRSTRVMGLHKYDTAMTNTRYEPTFDPNSGKSNTDLLMSSQWANLQDVVGNIGCPPAFFCRANNYDLPNREELKVALSNAAEIDAADTSGGSVTMAYMQSYSKNLVWSSSEYNDDRMNAVDINTLSFVAAPKAESHFVVPTRAIPV